MNVLIAEINPYTIPNPYIATLVDGIRKECKNIHISWGRDIFWSEQVYSFDIVHIMWPQFLLEKHKADEFNEKLDQLKQRNIKIVCTCHNIRPHYNSTDDLVASYLIAYRHSDLIFHLGNYSLRLFEKEYPNTKHTLLNHHVYDQKYTNYIDKVNAKQKLKLDLSKRYLLCFGAFRDNEERNLVGTISKEIKNSNIVVLAPSFFLLPSMRNIFKWILDYARWRKLRRLYPNIIFQTKYIKDEALPLYFASADMVLIQRLHILNSGNIPMAFYFAKPVIGPNIGNVGSILQESNNFTFDIKNTKNIPDMLQSLFDNNRLLVELGKNNQQFATRRLSTEEIVKITIREYNHLITRS